MHPGPPNKTHQNCESTAEYWQESERPYHDQGTEGLLTELLNKMN